MTRSRDTGVRRIAAVFAVSMALAACRSAPARPPVVAATPEPSPEPTSTMPPPSDDLTVKKAEEEVVVAAWAEPSTLSPGGGQAQILIRTQKRGGAPFPGVEVRLHASTGSLFSAGKVLVTDARGMTRDRLTTQKTAQLTLNAGGTRYRFDVPVLPASTQ
ncbi:MAG: hypothetical protein ACHQNV_01035 [Vicinamibacteria bacterium]